MRERKKQRETQPLGKPLLSGRSFPAWPFLPSISASPQCPPPPSVSWCFWSLFPSLWGTHTSRKHSEIWLQTAGPVQLFNGSSLVYVRGERNTQIIYLGKNGCSPVLLEIINMRSQLECSQWSLEEDESAISREFEVLMKSPGRMKGGTTRKW